MDVEALRSIGLTENEIKIYLDLLQSGLSSAYEISKRTNIYRVHVYDKLDQLIHKGLVTHVYKGAKKHFKATPAIKVKHYVEDKKRDLQEQEKKVNEIIPKLEALQNLPKEDTFVEVFQGKEGIKYFLKDVMNNAKETLITGLDERRYKEFLPIFTKQYFGALKRNKIKERVIVVDKEDLFIFDEEIAPYTQYRYLDAKQFNPANTFVYANKVVIVTWDHPVTAVMIKNKGLAETYKDHFEFLWNIASKKPKNARKKVSKRL